MFKVPLFIIFSSGAVLLSRHSLKDPQSHGFYRFFAFECIIALTLINIDLWFAEPYSPVAILAWTLLFASVVVVLAGFHALRTYGKSKAGLDQTTVLVTQGIFKIIRHPLYTSLILFTWGVYLKNPTALAAIPAFGATIFLLCTAKFEERFTREKFGEAYAAYSARTKMFFPFLF